MMTKQKIIWAIIASIVVVLFFLGTKVAQGREGVALQSVTVNAVSPKRFRPFVNKMNELYQFDKDDLLDKLISVAPVQSVLDAYRPKKKKKGEKQETPEEIAFRFERYVNSGVKFWAEHKDALERAQKEYGVLPEITVGLIGIETNYGTFQGTYNVFDALVTLAFYGKHRPDYFRNELESYLVLVRDLNLDIKEIKGSYAGAIGIPQFMPSAYRPFAVEWDGLHQNPDIFHSYDDAIGSAVNFLVQHGWDKNQPIATQVYKKLGKKTFVSHVLPGPGPTIWLKQANYTNLMHYNPSDTYVMSIFILGQRVRMRYEEHLNSIQNTEEIKIPAPNLDMKVESPVIESPPVEQFKEEEIPSP
jgi:membrane-bound lytic murein transglycosylase B